MSKIYFLKIFANCKPLWAHSYLAFRLSLLCTYTSAQSTRKVFQIFNSKAQYNISALMHVSSRRNLHFVFFFKPKSKPVRVINISSHWRLKVVDAERKNVVFLKKHMYVCLPVCGCIYWLTIQIVSVVLKIFGSKWQRIIITYLSMHTYFHNYTKSFTLFQ